MKNPLFLVLPVAFLAACSAPDPVADPFLDDLDAEVVIAGDRTAPAPLLSPDPLLALEPATTARAAAAPRALNQDPVIQGREIADLRQQKTLLLVEARLEAAMEAYADGRLLEAENAALAALQLDPGHRETRAIFDQIQVALGRATVPLAGSEDDLIVRLRAHLERLKAESIAHAERGFRLLEKGELQEALAALSLAHASMSGADAGYDVDWKGMDLRVTNALKQARAELEISSAAKRDQDKRDAFEQMQAEEEALARAETLRLDRILSDAVRNFENRDYEKSLTLAEEVLDEDPLNLRARELRDTANRARHELLNETFLVKRTERFKRWLEDLEESKVPFTGIMDAPELAHWAKITDARERYRGVGDLLTSQTTEEALRVEIASTRIPGIQVEGETSLDEVIQKLRPYTDIPFVVTPSAIEAVDAEGIEFNLNLSRPITVENALNVITQAAGEDVVYTFRYGVVYITSRSNAQGQLVLKAHDVQDLTSTLNDFSGPKIDRIHLDDDSSFSDDEEVIQGGPTGEPIPILDPANLEDLVRQTVASTSWDELEGVSVTYSNGHLIVVHTSEVHLELANFLDDMRRYISSMVTIEARFLRIQKDFLREIGVDFRGLGGNFSPPTTMANLDDLTTGLEDGTSLGLDNDGAGLPDGAETSPSAGAFYDEGLDGDIRLRTENILGGFGGRMTNAGGMAMQFVLLDDTQMSVILRAVEKSSRAQELNSTTISAQNTQRAFITVQNQVTYVQDMDVEVAQAALIADPKVGVISDGIVLDVRPTISHDRRYVTLELRPTVATLMRPMSEFTSSLAGLTTPVTLQLPELQVSSANTTAIVPDGGTVVIAGLKKIMDVQQRSEIPFLANIPLISLLFKSEAEVDEKEDIIITIRAQITDALEVSENLDRRLN